MSENVQEKKSSKAIIILLIIIILLLIGGGVFAIFFFNKDDGGSAEADDTSSNGLIHYDAAAAPIDERDYAERIADLYKEAEEGQMTLQFQTTAYSDDGTHFYCEIGNSAANHYDMYFNIYTDNTFEEQILLTGLFPPGSGITEFDSEIKFEPGDYKAVLVLTQVEDDHSTFHAQSFVALNLSVVEQ